MKKIEVKIDNDVYKELLNIYHIKNITGSILSDIEGVLCLILNAIENKKKEVHIIKQEKTNELKELL